MAGRYAGEMFVRVAGDERAARALMPAARLVMGEALEAAAAGNLGTYTLRRKLQDGSVIVAEKIGDLKRVFITVPYAAGKLDREVGGGFILWPRWNVVPFLPAYRGTEVDPTGEQPQAWLEFAGKEKITRYYERWGVVDDIEGARYEPFGVPELYPDGLRYFGNCDWKDGEDFALSFYGYVSRYSRDTAIADSAASFVFQQGQVLLDLEEYRAGVPDPVPAFLSWRINSACLRRNSVGAVELVVTFTNYASGSPTTGQSLFVVFSLNQRVGDVEKGNWVVQANSHRVLGSTPGAINPEQPSNPDTFADAAHPWLFNAEGTRATRTVNSEQTAVTALVNTITQEVGIGEDDISYEATQADYLIGNYSNSGGQFALVEPTRGLVATDFAGLTRKDLFVDFRKSEGWVAGGNNGNSGTLRIQVYLVFDGGEIPLIIRDFAVGNDRLDYHLMAYMDLRHSMYAGWRVQGLNGAHTIQPFAYMSGRMEYGAVETVDWDPSSGDAQPFPGLDTRAVGSVVDGLVFGVYWTGASGSGWGPRRGDQEGIIWRKHPREALTEFAAASLLVPALAARHGCTDFTGFVWPGGWNFNKGRYCVSMPGAYSSVLNYVTGGNMGELLGIKAEDRRFWPLSVLPKAI